MVTSLTPVRRAICACVRGTSRSSDARYRAPAAIPTGEFASRIFESFPWATRLKARSPTRASRPSWEANRGTKSSARLARLNTPSSRAKIIARELGVFSRASRAEDFVPRFASQLGLDARVGERALSLVAQGKDSKILEANSPVGIAAGALYLASEDLDVPLTQAQIARLTGVSEVTIRKHYRLLKDFLLTKENPSEAA